MMMFKPEQTYFSWNVVLLWNTLFPKQIVTGMKYLPKILFVFFPTLSKENSGILVWTPVSVKKKKTQNDTNPPSLYPVEKVQSLYPVKLFPSFSFQKLGLMNLSSQLKTLKFYIEFIFIENLLFGYHHQSGIFVKFLLQEFSQKVKPFLSMKLYCLL